MFAITGKRVWAMAAAASMTVAGLSTAMAGGKADELKTSLAAAVDGNAGLNDATKAFVKEHLLPLCTNEVFVGQTQEQNSKAVALDQIKKIDTDWQGAEEELPIQTEKLNNATATEIKRVLKSLDSVREVFVMDNQGAVVGENLLTSDYWQGDEEKWTNSFAGGKGGIDVGKVKFDKSANANLQQVSLPIIDASGTVIGAATFGLIADKF